MKLSSIDMKPLTIPFREAFQHAGATRAQTESVLVEVQTDTLAGYGEGCPRSYVTGESVASALAFFMHHQQQLLTINSLDALMTFTSQHKAAIDENPAAWCAVELSLLDALGKSQQRTLEELLNLPSLDKPLHYSAILGSNAPAAFAKQLARYQAQGFTQYKIKLSGDVQQDAACVTLLREAGINPTAVRADANSLWQSAEEAIRHLQALHFPFWAVEDPLKAFDHEALSAIASTCSCLIILDEYVSRSEQLEALRGEHWILNLRISKMGGMLRSLDVVEQARIKNMPIIVGAQVGETSILTRAAMAVANSCGASLLAQEGAFGTLLLEHDICSPPLMFGAGGVLEPKLSGYGLGLHKQ